MAKNILDKKKSSKFLGEKYLGSGTALKRAINKYGKENFDIKLLESCNSPEELNDREKYWILKFDAVNSDDFYNIIYGGIIVSNSDHPIDNSQPMLGKKHTEETKNKISQKRKGTISINNGEITKFIQSGSEIPDGWELGMIKRVGASEEKKKNQSVQISNRVFMHNQTETVLIKKDLIEQYLNNGYVMGKHPSVAYSGDKAPFYGKKHNQEFKDLISQNTKNTIWMNNEKVSVRIKSDDLEKYLSLGYKKGRLKK